MASESTPTRGNKADTGYSHVPVDGGKGRSRNGRVKGRQLITWTRPRMHDKLLLCIIYEVEKAKAEAAAAAAAAAAAGPGDSQGGAAVLGGIPWDKVAHRLMPGSSGQAAKQKVEKLRLELLEEGHFVPPPASFGPGITRRDEVRGVVEVEEGTGRAQRELLFSEPWTHPTASKIKESTRPLPTRKAAIAASRAVAVSDEEEASRESEDETQAGPYRDTEDDGDDEYAAPKHGSRKRQRAVASLPEARKKSKPTWQVRGDGNAIYASPAQQVEDDLNEANDVYFAEHPAADQDGLDPDVLEAAHTLLFMRYGGFTGDAASHH